MLEIMADTSGPIPSPQRLLSIIELQNVIAAAAFNTEEIMRLVAERAVALVGATAATVELVEGDDVVCRASAGLTSQIGQRRSQKSTLSGRCVAARKPVKAEDGRALCVPLIHGEHVVGVLGMSGTSGTFGEEDMETVRILANIIAIPLHRTRSFPRPRYDNTHDALTGLLNRRAFEERVGVEVARRNRYQQSFSLAVLDLIGFNTASDRFGEAGGDELLRTVGTILTNHTRVMDACFRLGGDEFAIVMPGTGLEGARIVIERCRAHILEANLLDGTVRACVGIVEAGEETFEALLGRAEDALRADRAAH
jgi:diguanylate cyclase (GGDEF)-like protein